MVSDPLSDAPRHQHKNRHDEDADDGKHADGVVAEVIRRWVPRHLRLRTKHGHTVEVGRQDMEVDKPGSRSKAEVFPVV